MGVIYIRANDALNINPPAGDQSLSVHGSDWLWAVTAIYVVSFIAFFCLSYFARAGERVFHYIFGIALLVGSVTYYSSASDIGFKVITQTDQLGNGLTRQIFFTKYINWVVAFPSVIISLGLLSGVSWATIVYQIFLSWFWVLTYLSGAFTTTTYKWGFFAFGTIAYLALAFSTTFRDGFPSARRVGVGRDHSILSGWVNLLWLLYPIAYGVSDGGNKIGVTAGWIFWGILDVLLIPLVAFATLFLSRNWDYNRLNLAFTQYGRVPVASGTFPEKATGAPAAAAPAAAAPAAAAPAGGPVSPEPVATV